MYTTPKSHSVLHDARPRASQQVLQLPWRREDAPEPDRLDQPPRSQKIQIGKPEEVAVRPSSSTLGSAELPSVIILGGGSLLWAPQLGVLRSSCSVGRARQPGLYGLELVSSCLPPLLSLLIVSMRVQRGDHLGDDQGLHCLVLILRDLFVHRLRAPRLGCFSSEEFLGRTHGYAPAVMVEAPPPPRRRWVQG